jgi:hypothetical protein
MRRLGWAFAAAVLVAGAAQAQDAPKVVATFPPADSLVPAGGLHIEVTFDRPMMDHSWSFATGGEAEFPEVTGGPVRSDDGKTFRLGVKLQPNSTYVVWFNNGQYLNFKDEQGHPATPYRLTFKTSE